MAKSETTVSMVKSMEEMQKAYDIRRQVFVVEGEESEEVEFDGNDFCAAHLLAHWKGEPVATMRMRIVSGSEGGTIIWERMAIMKDAEPIILLHTTICILLVMEHCATRMAIIELRVG